MIKTSTRLLFNANPILVFGRTVSDAFLFRIPNVVLYFLSFSFKLVYVRVEVVKYYNFDRSCSKNVIRLINKEGLALKMTNQKVFVYGTLKRNEPNHSLLITPEKGHSRLLGIGTTKNKYPLVIATKYNIPLLLYSPGDGHHVKGEIYEVDDKMMCNLDILEDHPNFYVREIDDIIMLDRRSDRDSGLIRCWVYFIKTFNQGLLLKPTFDDYSSKGSHGLVYLERSKRDPNYNHKKEIDNNESTIEDLDDITRK